MKNLLKSNVLILILLGAVLIAFMYSRYKRIETKLSLYQTVTPETIETHLKEFSQANGKYPHSKRQLVNFFKKKGDQQDSSFITLIQSLELSIVFKGDSVYVYDYGFDEEDDQMKITYNVDDNFKVIKGFFKNGDVVLYQGKVLNPVNDDEADTAEIVKR